MRVLLIAPNIDQTDVGEAFVAFKWAEALARLVDLTVLSFQRLDRLALDDQLPGARVITWPEPDFLRRHERMNAMLKPGFPLFSMHVRRWLTQALQRGERFDVSHQLMPQAVRYGTPLRHFDIPYVVGPLGGALETPVGFRKEGGSASLFTRLRALDGWRLRNDPWLRSSYHGADLVLGVAPYMAGVLEPVGVRRFEPLLELGIDGLAPEVIRSNEIGRLRILHVGRGVRTKGLRDAVRALGILRDLPDVTLTSAGSGEEIAICKAEAEELGVATRTTFLGRVPRVEVEKLYETHDVFVFPSYREPAGGVLYEAMRWGLPIITARRGGPEWIVDDNSGIRVPVTDPANYAQDIAEAILRLALDPELRGRLGAGARAKVAAEGLWPDKAARLVALYQSILPEVLLRDDAR